VDTDNAGVQDDENDINEHMDMETAYETTAKDICGYDADGWDVQTINEEDTLLAGDNVIRGVGGDNDITRDAGDNSLSSETESQASMDERYGTRSGHYNLRPWQERNTNGWNALLVNTSTIQDEGLGQEIMLTQYVVKQGLKIFGKAG